MGKIGIGAVILVPLIIALFGWPPFTGGADGKFIEADKYTAFETGVHRQKNGVLRVSALTRMPDVTPKMVHWWFADYLQTTEQYKRWHPTDHVWYDWEDKTPGAFVGASAFVHEYIGDELFKLRIQFVMPEDILGTAPMLGPEDVAVCARVGLIDQPFYGGDLCHIIRKTDYGSEMRSRFSLGDVGKRDGNERVGSIEGLIGNTYLARKLSIQKSDGIDLMTHAIEEMGYLADFLPALYASENGATDQ